MKKTLFILLCCLQFPLWAQENSAPKPEELLSFQTNTQQLLPGEYLYYSIRLRRVAQENPLEIRQKIAYIALADAQGQSKAVQQIILEPAAGTYIGQGELFIPTSLPTGGYTLLSYTPEMLENTALALPQIPIALLNPYSNARSKGVAEIGPEAETKAIAPKTPSLTLATEQWTAFSPPKDLPKNGRYNLSVRKISALHSQAYFNPTPLEPQEEEAMPKTLIYSAAGVRGTISSNSQSVDKIGISLSFLGQNMPFKMTATNAQGQFNFPLTAAVNSSQSLLHIWSADPKDFQIKLDSFPSPAASRIKKAALKLLSSDLEALQNRSIHNQIENAYNPFKQDSIPLENAPMSRLDRYEMSPYMLDDYTRFNTFEETVFELISELSYKKTSNGTAVLFCKSVQRNIAVAALPLLLLDGVPIADQNDFRRYPASEIKSISVSRQQLVMGDQIWNGLIVVQTFSGIPETYMAQKSLKIWNLDLPRLKKKYHQSQNSLMKSLPNYAQQLIWLPNQSPAAIAQFKGFKTPQYPGFFEVSIEGHSLSGTPYHFKRVYEVKD